MPPLGAVRRGPRRRDRDAPRPLRAAPAAADELPQPLAVRAAAVPGHDRPVRDPAVQRLRDAVPHHQHRPGRRHGRGAAPDVLAARPRRRRHRRTDRVALDALREALRARLAPGAGRAGRPRHAVRGGRGRHPRHQVLRPRRPHGRAVRRGGREPARHQPGQGPAVGALLDLPRGDPELRGGRGAAPRRDRRRPGLADARGAGRLHHPAAVPGLAGVVARRHPGDGPGGDDLGRPHPRDLRHRAGDPGRRPRSSRTRAGTCASSTSTSPSPTRSTSRCCATSTSSWHRARPSPSSAPPDPARRPSPPWCPGSGTSPAAGSPSTASTCATSGSTTCARSWRPPSRSRPCSR